MKIRVRIKTVNLRNIEFLIEEAFTGIVRNGLMAFASISTIALSLAVLGAFVLAMMGANHFTTEQIDRFEIAVFTVPGAAKAKADALADSIRKIEGIKDVSILDRDEEYAKFKRERPDFESAGLLGNPLPYALRVRIVKADQLTMLSTKIRALADVDHVNVGQETYKRVVALANAIRAISFAGVIILLITTAFIISNAIRLTLYARRREIRIMQLVGATNHTIRTPLVIEGIVFGSAGALVAWILLRLGGGYVVHSAQRITPMFGSFSSGLSGAGLAFWLLLAGAVIGAIGSLVSIRRFLKD
ncbi:MAG: permease-like cell division protein FtsX [Armatimonadetes bacterium]|nr:permease-like cell division protein FtsX [Armatimonadota bacterium]